jgi:endonuclease/exonuclease/phosphatase family metal-dependent hydrolase
LAWREPCRRERYREVKKYRDGTDGYLRVSSYNIHSCFGRDGIYRPDRVADVVAEMRADIVGLQEVDSALRAGDGLNQVDFIALHTGMKVVTGPTILRDTGDYGNALLTRFDIGETRKIDLSLPGREPRGALDVDLDYHGQTIRVVVTHLGLKGVERRQQIGRLVDVLARDESRPILVLGDMNEWFPVARSIRSFLSIFGKHPPVRTFPSWWPVLALDRIFVSPKDALIAAKVHATNLARVASDHLPVKALVSLSKRLNVINEKIKHLLSK